MEYVNEKDLINKKACEYRRKSTDDPEKQLFSLEDQDVVNKKVISRYGLSINKKDEFEESISAKKRGRPLFNKMVEMIEVGQYEVIACWALNRLARNSVDGAILIELMDDGKLFAIVTYGKVYFNTPSDKLLLSIEFGLSKKYSDDLSPAVKRGMVSKVKRGWWPGKPPLGYINIRDSGEETKQVMDGERFDILRKGIDLVLYEGYSPLDALDILNNKYRLTTRKTKKEGGLSLSRGGFYKILNDTFYHGKMVWGDEEAILHESIPRLMSEDEYWLLQEKLGSKGNSRPQKHVDLPYRGMIKCGECGSTWVPYKRIKTLVDGTKAEYRYIRCNCDKRIKDCTQSQISIGDLEYQISDYLDNLSISGAFCDWAIKWIKEEHKEEANNQAGILDKLGKSLVANQNKFNRLVDLHLSGLSLKEYKQKRRELETERSGIEREISSLECRTDNWMDQAVDTFDFAKNARVSFETGDVREKTLILKALGSNFLIKDGKLSIDLQKPFIEFKNNSVLVNSTLETIEPGVLVGVTPNNRVFEDWFFKWSG